ncbi:MAG: hypothetical protein AAF518_17140 [Spirochaetota bacterium]
MEVDGWFNTHTLVQWQRIHDPAKDPRAITFDIFTQKMKKVYLLSFAMNQKYKIFRKRNKKVPTYTVEGIKSLLKHQLHVPNPELVADLEKQKKLDAFFMDETIEKVEYSPHKKYYYILSKKNDEVIVRIYGNNRLVRKVEHMYPDKWINDFVLDLGASLEGKQQTYDIRKDNNPHLLERRIYNKSKTFYYQVFTFGFVNCHNEYIGEPGEGPKSCLFKLYNAKTNQVIFSRTMEAKWFDNTRILSYAFYGDAGYSEERKSLIDIHSLETVAKLKFSDSILVPSSPNYKVTASLEYENKNVSSSIQLTLTRNEQIVETFRGYKATFGAKKFKLLKNEVFQRQQICFLTDGTTYCVNNTNGVIEQK